MDYGGVREEPGYQDNNIQRGDARRWICLWMIMDEESHELIMMKLFTASLVVKRVQTKLTKFGIIQPHFEPLPFVYLLYRLLPHSRTI